MEEVLRRIQTLENKVDCLMQKEENLETTTKTLMQELNYIKGTSTTNINILNSKHQNNIDNIIKSINIYKQTKQQHPYWISCILELLDKRIVIGCCGGTLSINQMNFETKEWKVLTQKSKAHDGSISSLCEISNKRIISSSYDKTIKVWDTSSNNDIQLIKTITQHKEEVNKVIALTYNRFASCSDDCTVKLWNSDTYEQIPIPFERQVGPGSLLQLKRQREVLVISSCSSRNHSLHFYQSCQPYNFLDTINNVCTTFNHGLIELGNGHVAVSHYNPNCIYIVNPIRYELVATIVDKEYIPNSGPLFMFGYDSFIYVSLNGGCLCGVTFVNGEYKITFKTKENENDLKGNCLSIVNNGKFIIGDNKYGGCSVFKYSY